MLKTISVGLVGTGTVTNVDTGTGLTGGPITTTGTISLANTTVTAGTYGNASTVAQVTINAQGQATNVVNVAISIANSAVTGLGTMATQNANAVVITGGSVDNVTVGATTANTGAFTTLSATGITTVAAGSAALPAIVSITGTANTGIFFPAATTFAVSTAGVERMRIDSAGNFGIGGTTSASLKVGVLGTLPQSGGTGLGFTNYGTIASGTTSVYQSFRSALSTQAAAFTLPLLYNYFAAGATIGSGSAVTTQAGFFADAGLTTATNNYGFYGNIAAATGRYNFYAAGTADNYMAGSLGVGALPNVAYGFTLNKAVTGATNGGSQLISAAVQSDVTGTAYGIQSRVSTSASAFTLNSLVQFYANPVALGSTSTLTNNFGFYAESTITTGTNNYGFYGNIAAATGRYNLYMGGTADNYFAGSVGIGATANASALLDVQSTTKGVRMPNMTTTQKNAIASPGAGLMVFDTTLAKLCVYTGAAWQTITSV